MFDSLFDLRRGDVRVVTSVDRSHPAAKRLVDLGFVPGAEVEMIRPGSPCLVRLQESRLGLGLCLQRSIRLSRPVTAAEQLD